MARSGTGRTLVIVESPAKARTISKYLGGSYVVESSLGHIRDLPRDAAEVPESIKKESWARLGLNVDQDFDPVYVVPADKKSHVAKLRSLLKEADELFLATDDDREGESIAWHLADELKPRVPIKRMVFHEITREAIDAAIKSPRAINDNLVQAQETRRALDRLYGFEVSPVLWKKVKPKLSAGRVQSVATRMLVDRERERMRFHSADFWDIEASLRAPDGQAFNATLIELGGKRVATGKDFDSLTGQLRPNADVARLDETKAKSIAESLLNRSLDVSSVEERPYVARPYPPFITSTLQQEANRKLGFATKRTMSAAQRLYEAGHITYMRTDSSTLSAEAINAARTQVTELYGKEYLHGTARTYDKKVKNAQEAHEAIRPAGSSFRKPETLRNELSDDEFRLYDLIWKRTVASQMADARGRRMQVRVSQTVPSGTFSGSLATFTASGKAIDFAGFLRAYVEGSDDPDQALEDREVVLPPLKQGDKTSGEALTPKSHTTQPPARYTEASLVQALEAAGIGRPSTYASIIQTIQDRGYVLKKGQALIPTLTAFATVKLLEGHFTRLVDYDFTARMEEDLDEIAAGRQQRLPYLKQFYFGSPDGNAFSSANGASSTSADPGLKQLIATRLEAIDPRVIATVDVPRLEGTGIEVRVGRYGPFLKRGEASVTIPDEIAPDDLNPEFAERLFNQQSAERVLGTDDATGLPVIAKSGRFGPYVTLGDPSGGNTPAKTASLFPSDSLEALTFERALKLLSLPRLVGAMDGEEIWAFNGRYGPYIKKDSDTRSLTDHEQLFTLSLDQAKEILAQPKTRRGQSSRAPIKTLEFADRKPIIVQAGRFGPYLTDGEINASLRRDEDPETLDAGAIRQILEERGKPSKRAARAKTRGAAGGGAKAAKGAKKAAGAKTAGAKPKKNGGSKEKDGAEKVRPPWADVEPFTKAFDDTTASLLKLVNGDRIKLADAAEKLGVTKEDAMARYRASNFKLYAAYRKSKATKSA